MLTTVENMIRDKIEYFDNGIKASEMLLVIFKNNHVVGYVNIL